MQRLWLHRSLRGDKPSVAYGAMPHTRSLGPNVLGSQQKGPHTCQTPWPLRKCGEAAAFVRAACSSCQTPHPTGPKLHRAHSPLLCPPPLPTPCARRPALTYMVSTGGWPCRSLGKACPQRPSGPNSGSLWKALHTLPGHPTPSAGKSMERWIEPPPIFGVRDTELPHNPMPGLGTGSMGSS